MKEIIYTEGETLSAAIMLAANQLGGEPNQVEYKFELDHFRTPEGRNKPVETVRISAWLGEPQDVSGAESAKDWLQKLTSLINVETKVQYRMTGDKSAEIVLKSDQGGRLVGRKGSSLKSIQTMLLAAMTKEFSDWKYRLEVSGGKKAEEEPKSRRSKLSNHDIRKLENLAVKLSKKVINTKKPLLIRQALNSFERRVVHLKVQSIDGVSTESIMDKDVKKIRIVPDVEETPQDSE